MKRIFLLVLLCIYSAALLGQTRPDYLDIKNAPIRLVTEFGTVSSANMQKAIDTCASSGAVLTIPAGTYTLTADTLIADEQYPIGNTTKTCLVMRSGMHIVGIGSVTLKLADNESTLAAVQPLYMFASNGTLSNITFENITFDMNGANNRISPSAPGSYALINQAHIAFSGTPGGIAARGDNIIIRDCVFKNTAGVSCIVMAQSNSVGITLGKNWRIENCQFLNNGLDTIDHSSIYGWADNVVVTGCLFENDTIYGPPGGCVAYEFHGSNQWFENNKVINYRQGAWLASNLTAACYGQYFVNNYLKVKVIGVGCFRSVAAETPVIESHVLNNTIIITDDADPESMKAGLICAPQYGFSNVTFSGNTVIKNTTVTSTALPEVTTANLVAGQNITRIDIIGNRSYGTTHGVRFVDSGAGTFGELTVENNEWNELTPNGDFTYVFGVSTSGVIDALRLVNNRTVGQIDAVNTFGSYLPGSFTSLIYYGNFSEQNINEVLFPATEIASFSGSHPFLQFDEKLFSGNTEWTVGNGSSSGLAKVENDEVTIVARFVVGDTTSIGTDTLYISVPHEIDANNGPYNGNIIIYDATDGSFKFGASVAASGSKIYGLYNAGVITGAYPIMLAQGDSINVSLSYKRK